jgi:arabinogalactan oligomer/maltooligosaccharide transport system substrate-binding protein
VINGPWAFQPYEAAGINYGVAPLPTLPDGKPMSSFLGVKGYVVSTWSKDKALAQQFIEFINQPQYVKARYVATGEIPPLKAMIDDPVIKNDEKPARWRCSRARHGDAGHPGNGRSVGAGERRAGAEPDR